MYPPICHCLHLVLFATPSVMISIICVPCGARLPMLGLGCATNTCTDLFLRPYFVTAGRLRNTLFCALRTSPCGFFNTCVHCTAWSRSCTLRSQGPGHHRPLCHAIIKETGPLSTAASECLRVAAPSFHEHPQGVPKGSATGYIQPSYPKTRHLRRSSAIGHICFKVERTLSHGAFCAVLSFCHPCVSSHNGK